MGNTRDLFKKVRETKWTFHAKMGTINDRNDMDLQKQKILRRCGKNTGVGCHFLCQEDNPILINTSPRKRNAKKENDRLRRPYKYLWKEEKQKSKGEKERYTHLNAEFQRIARRDKKGFLSDQCKEIEEDNRMGKTRSLFKKTRDTKWTFHAKMGSIKDRNGMDLTESRRY